MEKPTRPNVKQPAVWSWASQQILSQASFDATTALAEDMCAHLPQGSVLALTRYWDVIDRIQVDPGLRLEYYSRCVHYIDRCRPYDGYSDRGAPVDRAEARLMLWLNTFNN